MRDSTCPLILTLLGAGFLTVGQVVAGPVYLWTNYVGRPGGCGFEDGPGDQARFCNPSAVATDAAGNIYVTDWTDTLRRISSDGVVVTLARGFSRPLGIAVGPDQTVYVADNGTYVIKAVSPSGVVQVVAGGLKSGGHRDGVGTQARFWDPRGIALDASGNLYVADGQGGTLRKINPSGEVSTVVGQFLKSGSAEGWTTNALLAVPDGVAVDNSGRVYIADSNNGKIRIMDVNGWVSTLAGSGGSCGVVDGVRAEARFCLPAGITVDAIGDVYVSELFGQVIRRIEPGGRVTTIAGSPNAGGYVDGFKSNARFNRPRRVAADRSVPGLIYVADSDNHVIRSVEAGGTVRTHAGTASFAGATDGPGESARFTEPTGLCFDTKGNLYVADVGNHIIRKIDRTGIVVTLAGMAGETGVVDGTGPGARFSEPRALALDRDGSLLVADRETVRRMSPDGQVRTLGWIPFASPLFSQAGLTVDAGGRVLLASPGGNQVLVLRDDGQFEPLEATFIRDDGQFEPLEATLNRPTGLAADPRGNVYVADSGNHTIRKIDAAGLVTTLAGAAGESGLMDGWDGEARFQNPTQLALDREGNLFVVDSGNRRLRVITRDGTRSYVTTVLPSGPIAGTPVYVRQPTGVAVDSRGHLFVSDSVENRLVRGTPIHHGPVYGRVRDDFNDVSGLNLLNSAFTHGGRLYLTPAMAAFNGTATEVAALPLGNGFETTFSFKITEAGGALDADGQPGGDGLALVLHKQGPETAGRRVGYIPYSIPDALAVEFDTWRNANLNDPNGNHVSVQFAGPTPDGGSEFTHDRSRGWATPGFNLSDGATHPVRMAYGNYGAGGVLNVFVDGNTSPLLTLPLNLSGVDGRSVTLPDGRAWLSLAAGTGGTYEVHQVENWSIAWPAPLTAFGSASLVGTRQVGISFANRLDWESALNPQHYWVWDIVGGVPVPKSVTAASRSPDGSGVLLDLDSDLAGGEFVVQFDQLTDVFRNALPPVEPSMQPSRRIYGRVLPQARANLGVAGDPAVPGMAFSSRAGDFEVLAGGSDTLGTTDTGHFIHQVQTGDFDVRVRVESLSTVNRSSSAGLMVRESLDPTSRQITVSVLPAGQTVNDLNAESGQNQYRLSVRSQPGQPVVRWESGPALQAPPAYPNAWIRLRRSGSTFAAFRSSDGLRWEQLGSAEMTWANTTYLGLMTTAHDNAPGRAVLARYRDYGPAAAPPVFVKQPASLVTVPGGRAVMESVIDGNQPLQIQWRRNGVPIPSATSATVTIDPVRYWDLGQYDVVVTNMDGAVTSFPASLTLPFYGMGGLKADYYFNIPGTQLAALTEHSSFLLDQPGLSETTSLFEPRIGWRDNYGARLSGWLVPPVSGIYQFYFASDDQGELFFSADAQPANARSIATEPAANGYREFVSGINQGSRGNPPRNISTPIFLQAGQPRYVEARFKEGGGGDHLSVTWRGPGGDPVRNGITPISGLYLASEPPIGSTFAGTFAATRATSLRNSGQIGVDFGRPMSPVAAVRPDLYQVDGVAVTGVTLSPDRRSVVLQTPGLTGNSFTLHVGAAPDVYGNLALETNLTGVVLSQGAIDIGTPGVDPVVPGLVVASGPEDFEVVAGGSDVWDRWDACTFVHGSLTGDFDLQVCVKSLDVVDRWSKAGLMVRENLTPNSRHIYSYVQPRGPTRDGLYGGEGNDVYELAIRTVAGGTTGPWQWPRTDASQPPFPNAWLRLHRQGNAFTTYRSADGRAWVMLGQTNQTYPSAVFVGLATTAHNNSADRATVANYRGYTRADTFPALNTVPTLAPGTTVAIGSPLHLEVVAGGPGPMTYQWRRNGVPLPGATSRTLDIASLQPSDPGLYDVVVANAAGSVQSPPVPVSLAPLAITVPPVSTTVAPGESATLTVTAVGTPPFLFQWLKNGIPIPNATNRALGFSSVQEEDIGSYRVTIRDQVAPLILTSAPAILMPKTLSLGGLKIEYFLNLPGGTLTDLTNAPAFRNNQPDIVEVTPFLEARRDWAENYGARLSGWLIPPTNGDYRFFLSSDDQGELWLSTDHDPANRRSIAREPQWNGYREYENGANQNSRNDPAVNVSGLIPLKAGKAYYVEALFKEGGVADHLSVAWMPPGDDERPATGAAPIWGRHLAFGVPDTRPFQPTDATIIVRNEPVWGFSRQICLGFGRLLEPDSALHLDNYDVGEDRAFMTELSPDHKGVMIRLVGGNPGGNPFAPSEITVRTVKDILGQPSVGPVRLAISQLPQVTSKDIQLESTDVVSPMLGRAFAHTASSFDVAADGRGNGEAPNRVHRITLNHVTGDFDLRVRVASLEAVDESSEAGLILSYEGSDRDFIALTVTPAGPTSSEGVLKVGRNTHQFWLHHWGMPSREVLPVTSVFAPAYPNAWLRLQRTGARILAYRSADAATWSLLGETFSEAPNMSVGLVAASHDPSRFADRGLLPTYPALSRFREFQITGATNLPPYSTGLGATTLQDQILSFNQVFLLSPILDPEGREVRLESVSSTSTNGASVSYKLEGLDVRFAYTPRPGYVGADEIRYLVSDIYGAIGTAALQIAVLPTGTVANEPLAPSVTADGVTFGFTGTPGKVYYVQRSASPAGPWETVGAMVIQPDGFGNFVDPTPPAGSGFYRLLFAP